MRQKIMKYVYVILVLLVIVIGIEFVANYYNSVDITDNSKLIQYISNKDHIRDISILKEKHSGKLFSILYKGNDSVRLILLERTEIPNRYKILGGSHTGQSFGTFNYGDSKGTLIIVFGDNSVIKASKYSMKNDDITYSENIENTDYVLRIFRTPDNNTINSDLYLYDTNNNQIGSY